MSEASNRVGEIIETSTSGFTVQCYELYESPPLGSLVKTADEAGEQYGIVCNVTTSGIEPGRRPIARGKDEANEADIYRSNPQLGKLLRTEFSALVVGHKQVAQASLPVSVQSAQIRYYLPPRPPRIHSFVYECQPEEVKEFGRSFDFLPMLLGAQLPVAVEEIMAASLRQMSTQAEDAHHFLIGAGKELAVLLGNDYGRLRAILGRLG